MTIYDIQGGAPVRNREVGEEISNSTWLKMVDMNRTSYDGLKANIHITRWGHHLVPSGKLLQFASWKFTTGHGYTNSFNGHF